MHEHEKIPYDSFAQQAYWGVIGNFVSSKIGKLGNRTTTWNITRFIDEIFRELLAYLKCFDEFCIKVVHTMV